MRKQIIFILLILVVAISAQAQKITFQMCLDSAVENYPNTRQLVLNKDISDLNIENIKRNYYPSLNINAQAHYQSDVTKVPVMIPEFAPPDIPKDWYKVNLDVEQMIYDGGVTSGQKKVEYALLAISDQKVQIELYRLKERINTLFFNIIFLKKNAGILMVLHKNLRAKIDEAEIAFMNGVLLSSTVDALKVELYSVEQQQTEINEDQQALLSALSEFTGMNIPTADYLVEPKIEIETYSFENNRPEYILLNKQQEQVMSLRSLTQSKRRPVFKAFGQLGYGRPGYDMLNVNFDDYYMIGLRLHWNIWDWGRVKREKQVYDLQNSIISSKKETFNQNLRSDLYKRIGNIEKYEMIVVSDSTIVSLQTNVVNTAESQFKNGTITSTNYLIEVNKLVRSKLNLESHKLKLVFAKFQYLTTIGNL